MITYAVPSRVMDYVDVSKNDQFSNNHGMIAIMLSCVFSKPGDPEVKYPISAEDVDVRSIFWYEFDRKSENEFIYVDDPFIGPSHFG